MIPLGWRRGIVASVAAASLVLGAGLAVAVAALRDDPPVGSAATSAEVTQQQTDEQAHRLQALAARDATSRAAMARQSPLALAAAVVDSATAVMVVAAAGAVAAADAAAAAKAPPVAAEPAVSAAPAPVTSIDPCATTYNGPPFFSSAPTVGGDGSNGKIPADQLAALSWRTDEHGGQYFLRTDAAAALERLNTAFAAEFGVGLGIDMAYRDYATQVAMRDALGAVAADPGTSRHGLGIAIDLKELPCQYGWDSPGRAWMLQHGPDFGWVSPSWLRQGGSNPEYWHYEYVG